MKLIGYVTVLCGNLYYVHPAEREIKIFETCCKLTFINKLFEAILGACLLAAIST